MPRSKNPCGYLCNGYPCHTNIHDVSDIHMYVPHTKDIRVVSIFT